MPRGRPPLPRTKEEALNTRREQVRKNVQAFRQKKKWQRDLNADTRGEGLTLVSENVRHWTDECRTLAPKALPELHLDDKKDTIIIEKRPNGRSWGQEAASNDIKGIQFPFVLPQQINAARMSLQQLASNASSAFVPSGSSTEIGPHWSQMFPALVNTNPILDLSIQAICLIQTSTVDGAHHLIQPSMSYYSRASQALRKVMAEPNPKFSMEIFAVTMTLSGFELLLGDVSDQRRSWMHHVEGAISYLNTLPPSSYSDFACSHVSFHFLESLCIFDALGARRPSSFSPSKWWQISVDKYGDEIYGALLRLMTMLPAILEQCDQTATLPEDAYMVESCKALFASCSWLEIQFAAWYDNTRQQLAGFKLVETVLIKGMKSDMDIEFPTLYIARLYLLYWSSMVLLFSSMAMLQDKLSSTLRLTTIARLRSQKLMSYSSQTHTFALNVRYSIHYCLKPRHGIVGKCFVLLPLWIAKNALKDCGDMEAKAWCDGVLEGIGHRNLSFGLTVGRSR